MKNNLTCLVFFFPFLYNSVMDAASRPGCIGFITCPQLAEVFHGVGLKLSPVEIELLATGAFLFIFFSTFGMQSISD